MDLRPAFQLSTTAVLLFKAKAGQRTARNALFDRVLPRLRRMASARLPSGGIGGFEAEDIVQETLLRAFHGMERFEPRCEGAFLFYLRRILANVIADQGRKLKRAPAPASLEHDPEGRRPSPIEEAVGGETWETYQRELDRLPEGQREAVALFVECGMGFEEISAALESPSVDAARMVVARGLKKLAERMHVQR